MANSLLGGDNKDLSLNYVRFAAGLLCPVLLLLSSCRGLQHQFCHDLTDYGKLYFTKVKVNVCNVTVESQCKERTVSKCIQVPGVRCRAELFTEGDYFELFLKYFYPFQVREAEEGGGGGGVPASPGHQDPALVPEGGGGGGEAPDQLQV